MLCVRRQVVEGGFSLMLRHRLHCSIVRAALRCDGSTAEIPEQSGRPQDEHVVLNELVMDRGMSPFLTSLDCYCDNNFVQHVQVHALPGRPAFLRIPQRRLFAVRLWCV